MSGNKYVQELSGGQQEATVSAQLSTDASAVAGNLVALNSDNQVDSSLLPASPSTQNPLILTLTAAVAITQNQLVNVDNVGNVQVADSALNLEANGIALANIDQGASGPILMQVGVVAATFVAAGTHGFLNPTGSISTAPATGLSQKVGLQVGLNLFVMNLESPIFQ